jgi:DNA topoisomerase-1
LIVRHYVERIQNALVPTTVGETVAKLLVQNFPDLLDVQFTATLEEDLDIIEEGKKKWEKVVRDFYEPFHRLIEEAKVKMKDMKQELEETGEKCEKCGKSMVIRMSRYGRFIACSGFPACKNTKSLTTDIPCPKEGCDGKLVKRKNKRGQIFYGCSNFPKCDHITNQLPKTDAAEPAPGAQVPPAETAGE